MRRRPRPRRSAPDRSAPDRSAPDRSAPDHSAILAAPHAAARAANRRLGPARQGERRPPEFIESAYFLRFRFDEGTYAFVGRESIDGEDVLRIEYYPAHLFSHDTNKQTRSRQNGTETRDEDLDAAVERMLNKVSLVTLWVEPKTYQIVKYTFDNVNMDFLPAAWLVRVTDGRASMSMSQAFKNVWLPKNVDMVFGAMIAVGSFDARYHLDFHDYKEATTTGRIKLSPEEHR